MFALKEWLFIRRFLYVYIFISAVFEMFTMKVLSMINKELVLADNISYLLGIAISNLLLISVFYLASKIKLFRENELPKYSWVMLILPITSILLVLSIDDYYFLIGNDSLILVVVGLFLLIVSVFLSITRR